MYGTARFKTAIYEILITAKKYKGKQIFLFAFERVEKHFVKIVPFVRGFNTSAVDAS